MSDESSRKKIKRYHLRGTSTQLLLHLNDDCLFKLFECLHPKEFFEMANVCQRLKTLAQDYFSLKYKNYVLSNCATYRNKSHRGSCTKARNLITNFGGCIQKITLSHSFCLGDFWNVKEQRKFKLSLITKYCTNLTHVTIRGFVIKSRDTEMWKSLFANISTLIIEDCQLVNVTLFFVLSLCPKLKSLSILNVDENISGSLMDTESTPTDLEEIELNYSTLDSIHHQRLEKLIQSNIHLRKLHISCVVFPLDVKVKELKRLISFPDIELIPFFPHMSVPGVKLHIELDDDNHGATDELDCGIVCTDEELHH